MICPKCGAEYREGFYRCADCNVALVRAPEIVSDSDSDFDSDEDPESSNLITVLETKNSSFLSELVDLIEQQQIPYLVQSGTALDLDVFQKSSHLEWRAVLLVPGNLKDEVDSLITKVKSRTVDPANKPNVESY